MPYTMILFRKVLGFLLIALLSAERSEEEQSNKSILEIFWNSTGGSDGYWTQGSWPLPCIAPAICDPCTDDWYGIECNEKGDIVSLSLPHWRLAGSIPSAFYSLKSLTKIDLSNNYIAGSIATKIALLTNLTSLNLSENFLTGSVPATLYGLKALMILDIQSNSFHGSIAAKISMLTNLQTLNLAKNFLSGSLPSSISSLTELRELYLYSNKFSSSVPIALYGLKALTILDIRSNSLQGSIASEISMLTNLQTLNLAENFLSGSLPSSISSLTELRKLYLYSNKFSSSVPPSLGNLLELHILIMHNNCFNGSLSNSLGNLVNIEIFWIDQNRLEGTVPSSLQLWSKLRSLSLHSNVFTGSVNSWLGDWKSLEALALGNNKFASTLPSGIGELLTLSTLYLNNNQFDGPIPATLGQLRFLKVFDARNNFLSSYIPSELGQMRNLEYLYLSNNSLDGSIPHSFATLTNVTHVFLDSNALSGSLPACIGELSHLKEFSAKNNLIGGQLPSELGNLRKLQTLRMSNNSIIGPFPIELATIAGLIELDISGNELTGVLPSILFSSWTNMTILRLGDNRLRGQLPDSIDAMTALQVLQLENNFLTGPLPLLPHLIQLGRLIVRNNFFTGTIPPTFLNSPSLKFISLAINRLVGTLPMTLANLAILEHIDVHGNALTSDPQVQLEFFNSKTTPKLGFFDISSNNFMGPLPTKVFNISALRSAILGRNCFVGVIPTIICRSTNLKDLVLDGLAAGDACTQKIWPPGNSLGFDAVNAGKMIGLLPSCLLRLPNITQLHLSGNGLRGKVFDDIVAWPPQLRDLSVSNNRLSGTIPTSLQLQADRLSKLDISFNRFSGALRNMRMPTVHLYASGNRLSGRLSSSIIRAPASSLIVLAGNVFSCYSRKDTDFPKQDPAYNKTKCGSDTSNGYLYAVAGLSVAALLWRYRSTRAIRFFSREEALLPRSKQYADHMSRITKLLTYLILLLVAILMPSYGALAINYSSYTYSYLWTVSAGYKSGAAAGFCLTLLLTVAAVSGFALLFKYAVPSINQINKSSMEHINLTRGDRVIVAILLLHLLFIFTLNALVSSGVNIGFIFVLRNADVTQQSAAQLALGIFNWLWQAALHAITSERLVHLFLRKEDIAAFAKRRPGLSSALRHNEVFAASMAIFNNVILPILASMCANPNCYLQYFYRNQPVTSAYTDSYSTLRNFSFISTTADLETGDISPIQDSKSYSVSEVVKGTLSFYAPFVYEFQCSSSILSAYAPVVLTQALHKAFVIPFAVFVARLMLERLHSSSRPLTGIVAWIFLEEIHPSPKCEGNGGSTLKRLIKLAPRIVWPLDLRQESFSRLVATLQKADASRGQSLNSADFQTKHRKRMKKALQLVDRKKTFVSIISDLALLYSFGFVCPPLAIALVVAIASTVLLQRHFILAFSAATLSFPDPHPSSSSTPHQQSASAPADTFTFTEDEAKRLSTECTIEGSPIFSARWMLLFTSIVFSSFFIYDTAGQEVGAEGASWALFLQVAFPVIAAVLIEFLFYIKAAACLQPSPVSDDCNPVNHDKNPIFTSSSTELSIDTTREEPCTPRFDTRLSIAPRFVEKFQL